MALKGDFPVVLLVQYGFKYHNGGFEQRDGGRCRIGAVQTLTWIYKLLYICKIAHLKIPTKYVKQSVVI